MQNIFTVLNFFCTLHIHPSLSSNLWQIVIFTVLIVSLFPEGRSQVPGLRVGSACTQLCLQGVSRSCWSLVTAWERDMVEGTCHEGKSLQGGQNVLASGSCLQALLLLTSHIASACHEWVRSQGRRSEESKHTNSCIAGMQTIPVFAAKLMPAGDPIVQFSQAPWELLARWRWATATVPWAGQLFSPE